MKNIAIILAGGTGSRIGEALPKQFLEVAGTPIIVKSKYYKVWFGFLK